ncbi:GNAT family N-acetyltransferase [Glycomyces tritici]|uniref:GNAT family protein n=1 Tax=Glycomyces tritici TaxID=2665176 RepID=A0ABT7YX70_9ACTN|nr:GNAT family protein [Glycomyces tritici]MDN3242808.1 GNAT family protein [Glycomyces tritici]
MLKGKKTGLRARHEADIPVLQDELGDALTTARATGMPWRPFTPGSSEAPFVVDDTKEGVAHFSVVDLADEALVGTANLWGIDKHARSAHIGLGLLPSARGKGFATDVVAVLCHYGFIAHGLHRLQIETLADNTPMLRAAERNGFQREGVRRDASWVMGEFLDEVVLGLLVDDWTPDPAH